MNGIFRLRLPFAASTQVKQSRTWHCKEQRKEQWKLDYKSSDSMELVGEGDKSTKAWLGSGELEGKVDEWEPGAEELVGLVVSCWEEMVEMSLGMGSWERRDQDWTPMGWM
jgi:hypothetical protein